MNETRDRDNFTPEGWHTVTPRIVVHEAEHIDAPSRLVPARWRSHRTCRMVTVAEW